MTGPAPRPSRSHGADRPACSRNPDRSHPARTRRSDDRAVRPRNQPDPHQTRRPGQSWPAAISPCAMPSTRTPRAVSATRCRGRGWTRPYRTASTRLSASTGLPAVTACKTNTSSSRRASSASVRGTRPAVVLDTNVRASTDTGVDPPDLPRSHHPGHARAADTASSSARVDSQECRPYPQQAGVQVRLLVPVQHSLVATLVDQGHPRASHPQAHSPAPAEPPRRAGLVASSDTPTHPARAPPPTRCPRRTSGRRELDPGHHDAAAGQLPTASAEHKPSPTPARLLGPTPERR
jgi:hypothetical protein